MQQGKELSNLVKMGILHGALSGCVGAALFTLIAFFVLCLTSCPVIWLLGAFAVGSIFGAIPATFIGAIAGLAMAGGFYLLQEYLEKHKVLLFFVALSGLFIAMPGIVLWLDFFLNDFNFGGLPSMRDNLPLLLILSPICLFASIHVAGTLYRVAFKTQAMGVPFERS